MAKTRRIIRKQHTVGPHAFDDQLWPVLLALTVLTGFVIGALTVYLRFDDPRWYANAMTWLIMAGIAMTATAVALVKIDNRKFRRSLQLAILLGLFIHFGLFVTSLELHIFDPIRDLFRPDGEPQRPLRVVTVPEYVEREQRRGNGSSLNGRSRRSRPNPSRSWNRGSGNRIRCPKSRRRPNRSRLPFPNRRTR